MLRFWSQYTQFKQTLKRLSQTQLPYKKKLYLTRFNHRHRLLFFLFEDRYWWTNCTHGVQNFWNKELTLIRQHRKESISLKGKRASANNQGTILEVSQTFKVTEVTLEALISAVVMGTSLTNGWAVRRASRRVAVYRLWVTRCWGFHFFFHSHPYVTLEGFTGQVILELIKNWQVW